MGTGLAENWKVVKREAARALFADKEFGDGVHFAYRFRTDGTFSGTEMGKDVRGTWRVESLDFERRRSTEFGVVRRPNKTYPEFA
jgi:hypothetical protein